MMLDKKISVFFKILIFAFAIKIALNVILTAQLQQELELAKDKMLSLRSELEIIREAHFEIMSLIDKSKDNVESDNPSQAEPNGKEKFIQGMLLIFVHEKKSKGRLDNIPCLLDLKIFETKENLIYSNCLPYRGKADTIFFAQGTSTPFNDLTLDDLKQFRFSTLVKYDSADISFKIVLNFENDWEVKGIYSSLGKDKNYTFSFQKPNHINSMTNIYASIRPPVIEDIDNTNADENIYNYKLKEGNLRFIGSAWFSDNPKNKEEKARTIETVFIKIGRMGNDILLKSFSPKSEVDTTFIISPDPGKTLTIGDFTGAVLSVTEHEYYDCSIKLNLEFENKYFIKIGNRYKKPIGTNQVQEVLPAAFRRP